MHVELPEDLSAVSEVELRRIAANADHVRTEALLELRQRETSGASAAREQRLGQMSPGQRKAVEWLAHPTRIMWVAGAVTLLIGAGGVADCGSTTKETVGTTRRVIRDLEELMKDQPPPPPANEAIDKALGL